jgi:hypothetical protein
MLDTCVYDQLPPEYGKTKEIVGAICVFNILCAFSWNKKK